MNNFEMQVILKVEKMKLLILVFTTVFLSTNIAFSENQMNKARIELRDNLSDIEFRKAIIGKWQSMYMDFP